MATHVPSPYSLFNFNFSTMQDRKEDFQTPDGFVLSLEPPILEETSHQLQLQNDQKLSGGTILVSIGVGDEEVKFTSLKYHVYPGVQIRFGTGLGKNTFMHSISPLSVHTWFYCHPANLPTAQAACRDRRSCCRRCSAWSRIWADSVAHCGINLWYIVVPTYAICCQRWHGTSGLLHPSPEPSPGLVNFFHMLGLKRLHVSTLS